MNGVLPAESAVDVTPMDDAPRTGVELARRWALEIGLRPGHTWGVRPGALVPVVAQWAAARGWAPADVGAIGRGLMAAGLDSRHRNTDPRRLLLHRDDAARLRKLVWEAWEPRVPPGERPRTKPGRMPLQCALARLAYLERKRTEPPLGFHAQLAKDDAAARALSGGLSRATPVVDSRGRCYPSVAYAARSMVGKRDKDKAPAQLKAALHKDGHWHGMVWRKLLPDELALIPPGAPCGVKVEPLSWQATCQRMGLLTAGQSRYGSLCTGFGAVSRDDDREG